MQGSLTAGEDSLSVYFLSLAFETSQQRATKRKLYRKLCFSLGDTVRNGVFWEPAENAK